MAGTAKVTSWEDLKKLRENVREDLKKTSGQTVIAVGMATCGIAAGANEVMDALKDEVSKADLKNVFLVPTGCYGFCYAEPLVEIRMPGKNNVKIGPVTADSAREIIRKHIINGEPVIERKWQEVERV